MSESGEIIRRLVGRGMTGAQIGEAIGRDRSLISQVRRDVKPGANLADALRTVEARLDAGGVPPRGQRVAEPGRRTTTTGRTARVRRPTTIRGRGWSTAQVKGQGARSGGGSMLAALREADREGRRAAFTATFARRVQVLRAYGKRGRAGKGGTAEVHAWPADVLAAVAEGESVSGFVVGLAHRDGLVGPSVSEADLEGLELRTFPD